jgi:hypothetical protein
VVRSDDRPVLEPATFCIEDELETASWTLMQKRMMLVYRDDEEVIINEYHRFPMFKIPLLSEV